MPNDWAVTLERGADTMAMVTILEVGYCGRYASRGRGTSAHHKRDFGFLFWPVTHPLHVFKLNNLITKAYL